MPSLAITAAFLPASFFANAAADRSAYWVGRHTQTFCFCTNLLAAFLLTPLPYFYISQLALLSLLVACSDSNAAPSLPSFPAPPCYPPTAAPLPQAVQCLCSAMQACCAALLSGSRPPYGSSAVGGGSFPPAMATSGTSDRCFSACLCPSLPLVRGCLDLLKPSSCHSLSITAPVFSP